MIRYLFATGASSPCNAERYPEQPYRSCLGSCSGCARICRLQDRFLIQTRDRATAARPARGSAPRQIFHVRVLRDGPAISSVSPVAIPMTWTVLPITSAGRFSPSRVRVLLWFRDDHSAFGLADILNRMRRNSAADIGRSSLDRALHCLAIWGVNPNVTIRKIVGGGFPME
jgi:hypothetical protein